MSTKVFDGRTYSFVDWSPTLAGARMKAKRERNKGRSARIFKYKGGGGIQYHVYVRRAK